MKLTKIISDELQKQLDTNAHIPGYQFLVRVDPIRRGYLGDVERCIQDMEVNYCFSEDVSAVAAILTRRQVNFLSGKSYIKSMTTDSRIEVVQTTG